jgi:hypothetical protein
MAVTGESAGPAIRPFTIPVTPEGELEELRARIAATRGPTRSPELFAQEVRAAFRTLR